MTLYELVEVLCEERGVTTKIMAMRIGVSYAAVRNWKKTGAIPRWQTLIKLSGYRETTFWISRKDRRSLLR